MTLSAFSVANQKPSEFVQAVQAKLQGRDLGKIVSIVLAEEKIIVSFRQFRTSEINFTITQQNEEKFETRVTGEKIALAHRAFRSEIERKLVKVLLSCGASL